MRRSLLELSTPFRGWEFVQLQETKVDAKALVFRWGGGGGGGRGASAPQSLDRKISLSARVASTKILRFSIQLKDILCERRRHETKF